MDYAEYVRLEHDQVRPDMLLNVSYVGLRGVHLRQDININPRATGVGTDAGRQYQGFLNTLEDSNTAMSNYNAFQINSRSGPAGDEF